MNIFSDGQQGWIQDFSYGGILQGRRSVLKVWGRGKVQVEPWCSRGFVAYPGKMRISKLLPVVFLANSLSLPRCVGHKYHSKTLLTSCLCLSDLLYIKCI
jgi:hypothetical protein